MQQVYDWNSNRLKFTDVNGNKYDLKFNGNKTIVCGESATGKTLMCNMLQHYSEDRNSDALKAYSTDNIFILSSGNKEDVFNQNGKLVLIDRAEFLLTQGIIDFINADRGQNRYLIFLRKPMGIELSPNYFASLSRKDGVITIKYRFAVGG